MPIRHTKMLGVLRATSMLSSAMFALTAGTAMAQAPASPPTAAEKSAADESTIVVTGSRITRAGFDQPTPTTVIGETELRLGARPNLQQILNDQPQFRGTVTPQVSVGNTSTGTAPVDLRGLGTVRTLTLLDGRRFAGENNLNFVPTSLIERVEVVTGGASAAWGSGAVAGVVNIILKKDLQGLTVGAQSGISSRGDGQRYGFDASYGASFADGRGHFMIGGEYVDDQGVLDRNSRAALGSAGIVRVNPTSTTDLSTILVADVNNGNNARDGLITSGILAGQVFNADGTLRAFRAGTSLAANPAATPFPASMIGGADGVGLYDDIVASTPFRRMNVYGRLSYDIGNATVYVDATYGRATTDSPLFPDFTVAAQTISATNPFLSPTIRTQLANAGQTSFTLGRFFDDVFPLRLDQKRENKEGAIGIYGAFGNGFKYRAHYSHGEVFQDQQILNNRVVSNFANAINAVSSGGQIVCAINADAITTNDDPACAPLNPFGLGNASAASIAYVRAPQQQFTTTKLDSVGGQIQGDLFRLPAGPLTVVVGAEARWESQTASRSARTIQGGYAIPVFTSDLQGGFDVKEGFGEVAAPLIDVADKLKVDFNGAARYSSYSNSGGIWSWKLGGTARLFNDLLLRVTRSRDIRSPNIGDLFSIQRITIGPLVDQDTAGRTGNPLYNPTPTLVTTYSGGNPSLVPEIASTLTLGATYSPAFFPGFNLSVDAYDIKIKGAITRLSASNLTLACKLGNTAACARITRDANGTVTTAFANAQNIAQFSTRGIDIEASYVLPMSKISATIPGTLRIRALATYVDSLVFDTGLSRNDTAGDVGDATANGLPKWRGTLSFVYQGETIGLDARLRYVDGGLYDHLRTTLVNNRIGSRTYTDLGAQFRVADRFTFFGSVNNVFNVSPPLSTAGNPHYDVVGTYFNAGARVKF